MKKLLAKSGKDLVAIGDQGVVSGTNFLTSILLARYCAKEEFGFCVLALALLMFWENLRLALVNTPLTVFLPGTARNRRSAYVTGTFLMEIGFVLAGTILAVAGAFVVRYVVNDMKLGAVLAVTGTVLVAHSLRGYIRGVFVAQLRPHRALAVDAVASILQLGGIFALYNLNHLNAANALSVAGGAQLVGACIGLGILFWKGELRRSRFDLALIVKRHWKFGHWLIWRTLAYAGAFQVLPWFLKFTHGTEAVAALGACIGVLNIASPFWIGFSNILGARMAHAYARGGALALDRIVRRGVRVMAVVMGTYLIGASLFAHEILHVLYRGRYDDQGGLVGGLAINTLLFTVSLPCELGIVTMGRTHVAFYVFASIMAVSLTGGYAMISKWGTTGAMGSYVVAAFLAAVLRAFMYKYVLGKQMKAETIKGPVHGHD